MIRAAVLRLTESDAMAGLMARSSRRGGILACHAVLQDETAAAGLHTSLARLTEQLEYLRQRGFQFLPLWEFLVRLQRGRSVAGCLSLTFDDAYRGVLLAQEALRQLGIPATIFVPTGMLDSDEWYWWDYLEAIVRRSRPDHLVSWLRDACQHSAGGEDPLRTIRTYIMDRHAGHLQGAFAKSFSDMPAAALPSELRPMTWADLQQWLEWEGGDCAPHTITHPVLPRLSPDEQRREIRESYAVLRDKASRVQPVIAFPYGLYNATTLTAAAKEGMRAGVTMDRFGVRAGESELLRVPRIPFSGTTPEQRLSLYLTSANRWYRRREMHLGYPRLPSAPGGCTP